MAFDLTIRNGRISNADATFEADIGIQQGRITAIAPGLPPGREDVDATGRWVLPGGIDSHCHIEQLSGMGVMCADDFYSGTVSAAFGGTTTILSFAAQHRNDSIPEVLADYHRRAAEKAVIDYGFHLILTHPDEQALREHLPRAVRDGISSLKVYMTYDRLKLDDYQLLDVMDTAGELGALVMMHAENHDMIRWVAHRLLERGHTAPRFHAVAHDALAETEATHRAIALARLIDVPVLIVHVAGRETVDVIRAAQKLGAPVLAESCPQYLFLEARNSDLAGMEGAKFCCSPPPRDADSQQAVWQGLLDGTLGVFSSDHAPYRFDASGKLPKGEATTFKEMANGVPGIELRLPLLFSEGVMSGRMSIEQFVALTATNHARLYGLAPRKGSIAVGADADIALWDPQRVVEVSAGLLHDNVGYTPYEGRRITGWPTMVFSRGRYVVRDGELLAARGSGEFIPRGRPGVLRTAASCARRGEFSELLGLKPACGCDHPD
ncbi:MAG: dihydropyrimidinase [Candidatus Dactylopiibacterium carminicum]|uniref:D-hydantoinase n=1 Tax=Candidatus Dactylopiibacterium carminicum TaxID=857335 RepID=A0A272ES66_9RHOO|nr:dihydropyrimidinase [Candidatus Dactylopiibacterium carminicum]KAF7598910.1 dihydropyrimidinase [Candidatus Dactylopiibacterium carminicum]PAS92886.1 MAG: dihydropyrimidinase [Candidatus Dactylopiibacterium carminicum]PAS96464.1 MAG: dihydropyrimidinase [Candidatus Dactylopiibacterium carminicum]PAS98928.1 MAG: dihydropyrimidinase [Candidatus Dactylopiibacterium carminicum]